MQEVAISKGPPKEIRDALGLTLEEWILALLAYNSGRLDGATRLQKGLFLVKMEVEGAVPAEYQPGDYGPYSRDVTDAVRRLEESGLVDETRGSWGDEAPARVFILTEAGEKKAKEVLKKLKESDEWEKIEDYFRIAAREPLMRLLVLVYNWYPEYAKVSKIRRKVDYWTRKFLKWGLWSGK